MDADSAIATNRETRRYFALDGLRGIAAIAVALLHLRGYGVYPFTAPNHAVDLFFIMSGFVIASVYEQQLPSLGFANFIKRRILRLYPTYALSLIITPVFVIFIYLISRGHMALESVFISIPFQALYLPSPPGLVPPHRSFFMLNGPGWSLFWEMAINVAYAALVRLLTNRMLFAIVLFSAFWLNYLLFQGVAIDTGSDWPTWYVGAARVLFGFPLGILIYRYPRPTFSTPFWILGLLCAATLFLPSFVTVFIFLPFIVWLATGPSKEWPVLVTLGMLSYPLYAIHAPLIGPMDWVLHHLDKTISMKLIGIIDIVVFLALAWLVTNLWDTPVRMWITQKIASREVTAIQLVNTN